jgi:hypothetical protein
MPRTNVVGTTAPPGSGAQRCAQAGEREHRIDGTAGTAATAARSSPLLSAYDGCSRGKLGFEAFDGEELLARRLRDATRDRCCHYAGSP